MGFPAETLMIFIDAVKKSEYPYIEISIEYEENYIYESEDTLIGPVTLLEVFEVLHDDFNLNENYVRNNFKNKSLTVGKYIKDHELDTFIELAKEEEQKEKEEIQQEKEIYKEEQKLSKEEKKINKEKNEVNSIKNEFYELDTSKMSLEEKVDYLIKQNKIILKLLGDKT